MSPPPKTTLKPQSQVRRRPKSNFTTFRHHDVDGPGLIKSPLTYIKARKKS
ncbi:MAG: hypothetical protein WC686_04965 [Candidatus Shapirobacteria bacterium]